MATVAEQVLALKADIARLNDEIRAMEAEIERLLLPPVALPLPLEVKLHHDTIPVPGGLNVQARKSADWSDPRCWSTGALPLATDRVRIPQGVTVSLDCDAVCDVLVIDGALTVDTSAVATLTVTTMLGMPSSSFWCGDEENQAEALFELIFRSGTLDPVKDPGQYWNGLLWLGEFIMHGREKKPYLLARYDWLKGQGGYVEGGFDMSGPEIGTMLGGWDKGDELIVHDTRALTDKQKVTGYNQIERVRIMDMLNGNVQLSANLTYDHTCGWPDVAVVPDVPFRVPNVSRNLIIRNEKPDQAVSGHCMFLDHADVDIRYVTFLGIGRTLNEKLDPKTNHIGRYALHLHHLHHSFRVQGCVYDGGDGVNTKKWGIPVIHDCHYGTVTDNVNYRVAGAGVVTEEGNEWGNEIRNNTVIACDGKGGRADAATKQGGLAMQGCGFWASAPGSIWTDNYAANCTNYGHIATLFYLGQFEHPDGPGSHTMVSVDGNAIGFAAFDRNTSYACEYGGTNWWTGTHGSKPRPNLKPTYFTDFTAVNCSTYCWFQYPCADTVWVHLKTRGNRTALGFYGADYTAIRLEIRNPDMQGLRTGWSISVNEGPQTIVGGLVSAEACLNLGVPWTSGANATGLYTQEITVQGTILRGKSLINRFFPVSVGGKTTNFMVKVVMQVIDYQGKAGDNFKVYMLEQDPKFVPPATIPNLEYPPAIKVLGSPEPGLTNAALWAKYKTAVSGEITPCLTRRPGILGYVC